MNEVENCIFCKIVAGDIPCYKIYEDETALAFLDVEPFHRGHTLVIPKQHVTNFLTGNDEISNISSAIDATTAKLNTALQPQGMNLLSSAGVAAGQTVFHLHVHVIPRYAETPGLAGLFERSSEQEELSSVQSHIINAT